MDPMTQAYYQGLNDRAAAVEQQASEDAAYYQGLADYQEAANQATGAETSAPSIR